MGEVLFHCESTDRATLPTVPISKLCAGPIASEELVLDMDGKIPHPPGDPEEVPIGNYGPVDLHHDRWRVAVFIFEPPSEIEQDDGEILIDDHAGTQPVDQERAILITGQDALDLALAVPLA
jgi:hypothetical protein